MQLSKVLWQHRNRRQIVGAAVGVFVGFLLLLFAFQIFLDIQILMHGAKDNNLLVINRKVGLGMRGPFTPEDLDTFKRQTFFKDVGSFNSNTFRASVVSPQLGFRSELFLQSIPNRFLDMDTSSFVYEKGQAVPILLSSDYLALYNFGFAPSQGLPTFTAESIRLVRFVLQISGKGKAVEMPAQIMGFTRNVNSILVPENFLLEMNANYGEGQKPINQLLVNTDNPYHQGLNQFLQAQQCEISRGGLIGGELKAVLYLLIGFMIFIGLTILGLSLLVFVLNYQLIVAQAQYEIRLLLHLGYETRHVVGVLRRQFFKILGTALGLSFLCLSLPKYALTNKLVEQGYELEYWVNPLVWAVGVALALFFIWLNNRSIRQHVERLA
jgi:hypothetical protein